MEPAEGEDGRIDPSSVPVKAYMLLGPMKKYYLLGIFPVALMLHIFLIAVDSF